MRTVYLRAAFRGDAAAEIFRGKVEQLVQQNCVKTRVITLFTSQVLIKTQSNQLTAMENANVVYTFTCSTCKQRYVGHTIRRVEESVKEHVPKWLNGALVRYIRSSVTEHIVLTGYFCDPMDSFKIVLKTRSLKMRLFAEAVTIRHLKPELNVHRDFYQLRLQWG